MAFVSCNKFKASQKEQDSRLDALETCCESNSTKNDVQDKEIEALKQAVADNAQNSTIKENEQDERLEQLEQCCNKNSEKLNGMVTKDELGEGFVVNPETGKIETDGISQEELDDSLKKSDGKLGLQISPDEGNLLELRDNGVYYGQIAKVGAYYVDYQNGSDSNDGTISAPFKTFYHAVNQIKENTNNVVIYLKEAQEHIVHSQHTNWAKSFIVLPYGEKTDSMSALWQPEQTGWHVFGAKEYHSLMPTIKVIANTEKIVFGDTVSPTFGGPMANHTIDFRGIKFAVDYQGRKPCNLINWRSILNGSGIIQFIDCIILNQGSNGDWVMVDDHDHVTTVLYRRVILQSENPADAITSISKKIECQFEGVAEENKHWTGLFTWAASTKNEVLKASVIGALPPVLLSPNYVTNI